MNEIIITNDHYDGLDEIYTYFFICPACSGDVMIGSTYCSDCGVKFKWEHDPTTLEGNEGI